MKKYKKEVLIPTGEYANTKIAVEFDFDDDKKPVDCWFEVDEALKFQKTLIDKEMEMDANFGTTPKTPVKPVLDQTAPVGYAPTAPAVNTQPATQLCDIHNVQMKGRDGQYGWFYSHKDGQAWCNGKPKARYTA